MHFSAVVDEIVELPFFDFGIPCEFPVAVADGPTAGKEPIEGFFAVNGFGGGFQHAEQADAFSRKDRLALVFRGVAATAHIEESREEIDDVADLVGEGVFGDRSRPVGDERGCGSAFVHAGFVAPEWGVLGVSPAGADVGVILFGSRDVGSVVFAARGFCAAAVVGEKEDQRVVGFARLFKRRKNAADVLVHVVDHRGVNFHAQILPIFVFGLGPWLSFAVAWRESPFWVDESEFDDFLVSAFLKFVPAHGEFPFVFRDVLRLCVKRVVGSGVGNVN